MMKLTCGPQVRRQLCNASESTCSTNARSPARGPWSGATGNTAAEPRGQKTSFTATGEIKVPIRDGFWLSAEAFSFVTATRAMLG